MYMTGRGSSFLKGYSRHLRLGMRASGGSLYLITTPRNVFVSSVSAPDSSKFGFSFSTGGAFVSSLPPSDCPKSCSWFSSRLWRFSLRRSSCCRLSACWEANAPRSRCLSPPRSLSWGLSDSHLLRLSSGCSFLLLRSSPLARCSSRSCEIFGIKTVKKIISQVQISTVTALHNHHNRDYTLLNLVRLRQDETLCHCCFRLILNGICCTYRCCTTGTMNMLHFQLSAAVMCWYLCGCYSNRPTVAKYCLCV